MHPVPATTRAAVRHSGSGLPPPLGAPRLLYRLADLRQGGRRAHPIGAMWQEPGGRQRYKAGQRSAALRRSPMRRRTATSLAPLVVLMILTTSCSTMKSTYEENPKAVLGSL